jgi:hypothetical protein
MFDRLVVAALREEGYDDHFGDWTVLPLSRQGNPLLRVFL